MLKAQCYSQHYPPAFRALHLLNYHNLLRLGKYHW